MARFAGPRVVLGAAALSASLLPLVALVPRAPGAEVTVECNPDTVSFEGLAGYRAAQPDTGLPLFAFRLHQFISRGDAVYASPEPETTRHLTLRAQRFAQAQRRFGAGQSKLEHQALGA